jgi:hypothetical protein
MLELSVSVRANLAVQVDLFMLRGNPFHKAFSSIESALTIAQYPER